MKELMHRQTNPQITFFKSCSVDSNKFLVFQQRGPASLGLRITGIDDKFMHSNNPLIPILKREKSGSPLSRSLPDIMTVNQWSKSGKTIILCRFSSHPLHQIPFLDEPCSKNKPGEETNEHPAVNKRRKYRCPGHGRIEQVDKVR